jgi:hypothetical protein
MSARPGRCPAGASYDLRRGRAIRPVRCDTTSRSSRIVCRLFVCVPSLPTDFLGAASAAAVWTQASNRDSTIRKPANHAPTQEVHGVQRRAKPFAPRARPSVRIPHRQRRRPHGHGQLQTGKETRNNFHYLTDLGVLNGSRSASFEASRACSNAAKSEPKNKWAPVIALCKHTVDKPRFAIAA